MVAIMDRKIYLNEENLQAMFKYFDLDNQN